MNFISPEILMQNAIKNKYYKKPNDIYPPTEKDFDNSIHKFVSDKNNINNQRIEELQSDENIYNDNNIRYQDPEKLKQQEQQQVQEFKRPETFYIPTNNFQISENKPFKIPETFKFNNIDLNSLNPQVLIIIIIIMLMIIIYLFCKVENLQTLNKLYERNLITSK